MKTYSIRYRYVAVLCTRISICFGRFCEEIYGKYHYGQCVLSFLKLGVGPATRDLAAAKGLPL
jgi:hypothetical protein